MEYPSQHIEEAVNEISKLPGIGKKTALRLVLHLLKQPNAETRSLAQALIRMRDETKFCKVCHNISDREICRICSSPRRDNTIVCVIEDTRDVMAIENTGQYLGLYHVLGGVISPIEGIGPDNLNISSLLKRINASDSNVKELILALNPTMEGDTTSFFITKKISRSGLKVTSLARGVPVGGELEYADEITLGRSITARIHYQPN
ncbi:MAG: recombination protein RecR [Bacteroidetes bacterium]|nr:recombination protein RecR [Bacteroidota bacterium]